LPIRDILKNAEVRVFKVEQIHELIAADQIERALNLLSGQFEDDHEIIVQMSRLSELEKKQRMGILSEGEYNVEKNRIRDAVLKTLTTLAS
jgi:apolipoprotein N-acyltransferase